MSQKNTGQVVMAVMMGIMLVGGLVLWLAKGDFHMMGMHGGKHEKTGTVSINHHGSKQDPADGQAEGDEGVGAEQGTEGRAGMDTP